MKLYLVQHGEACTKDVNTERPLTDQGKRDIDRLATFFTQADIQVSRVVHSGKLRAKQTLSVWQMPLHQELIWKSVALLILMTTLVHLIGRVKVGAGIRSLLAIYHLWPNWSHIC